MKWNWGTKIALLYSTFVAFILFMVYLSFGQQFDLVTEDYYAEEIRYQETIDNKNRVKELKKGLKASIKNKELIIHFPTTKSLIKGELECFRPSDQNKDFNLPIDILSNEFTIPLDKFISGKYYLKVDWEMDGKSYYQEVSIIIP